MNGRWFYWRSVLAVWSTALVLAGQCLAVDRAHAEGANNADQAVVIRYLSGYGNVTPFEHPSLAIRRSGMTVRLQGSRRAGFSAHAPPRPQAFGTAPTGSHIGSRTAAGVTSTPAR